MDHPEHHACGCGNFPAVDKHDNAWRCAECKRKEEWARTPEVERWMHPRQFERDHPQPEPKPEPEPEYNPYHWLEEITA